MPFAVATADLIAASHIPAADRAFLSTHGREVLAARAAAPKEWQRWWYVCVAGELLFLPTIFLLVGRWRRSSAIRDQEEHDRLVTEEFEELASSDEYIEGVTGLTGRPARPPVPVPARVRGHQHTRRDATVSDNLRILAEYSAAMEAGDTEAVFALLGARVPQSRHRAGHPRPRSARTCGARSRSGGRAPGRPSPTWCSP